MNVILSIQSSKFCISFLEEQMLKRIFEEGLATQKNRLRELRSYAQGEILFIFRQKVNIF